MIGLGETVECVASPPIHQVRREQIGRSPILGERYVVTGIYYDPTHPLYGSDHLGYFLSGCSNSWYWRLFRKVPPAPVALPALACEGLTGGEA